MRLSPAAWRYIKIALTVVLLVVLLASLDLSRFAAALLHIDLRWLALGVLLCFGFAALRMFKWIYLSKANGLEASPLELVRAMAFALALGIVTPGRVGEVVAIAPFAAGHRPRALMAYVLDRIGELCSVLMFCAPAALLFLPVWGSTVAAALLVGSVAVAVALTVPLLHGVLVRLLPSGTPKRLREVLVAPVFIPAGYWLLSLFTYIVNYLALAVIIAGSEPIASPLALLVLPPVTLSNLITVTIGGLGVREGLAAMMAPLGSITPEAAAAAFFLSFVLTRLVPGLVGLWWTLARDVGERAQNEGK